MPIYEYQCKECEHRFDTLQRISDALLTDCPECGKPALKKLVSAPSFRLKGSGWYETDFKQGNKKNLVGGEKSASGSDSKDKAKDKANTKSADKPESKPAKKNKGKGDQAA